MDMDMSCALLNGAVLMLPTLKPLVQVSGLSDVERDPLAALDFFGQNVIGRFRPESSAQGINLILIFPAGLAGPIERRHAFRFVVTTEEVLYQVHLGLISAPNAGFVNVTVSKEPWNRGGEDSEQRVPDRPVNIGLLRNLASSANGSPAGRFPSLAA